MEKSGCYETRNDLIQPFKHYSGVFIERQVKLSQFGIIRLDIWRVHECCDNLATSTESKLSYLYLKKKASVSGLTPKKFVHKNISEVLEWQILQLQLCQILIPASTLLSISIVPVIKSPTVLCYLTSDGTLINYDNCLPNYTRKQTKSSHSQMIPNRNSVYFIIGKQQKEYICISFVIQIARLVYERGDIISLGVGAQLWRKSGRQAISQQFHYEQRASYLRT